MENKAASFLTWLKALRQRSAYTPIHTLLQEILTETGYLEYVTAKPGGEQRRANVEMLLIKAASFEKTSYYGLFHFLRYIKQLEKYQVDYGEADILDENADVVRIMSIHKSKGLEFPVCFVAGLSKKFNMQDTTGRLIADMDMGIGTDYVDNKMRIQSRTLRKNAVALKLKLDSPGEELRVLYVAMTRAMEKLFLTAVVPDCEKLRESMTEEGADGIMEGESVLNTKQPVPFLTLAKAGSFLDFILPCLTQAQIKWVEPKDMLLDSVQEELRIADAKHRLELSCADNKLMTELSEKFERTYPHAYLKDLFVKTSVSELKKAAMEQIPDRSMDFGAEKGGHSGMGDAAFTKQLYEEPEMIPYLPGFLREKEDVSGAERGSAYHKVLELLEFERFAVPEDVTKRGQPRETEESNREEAFRLELLRQIKKMVQSEKLSEAWADSVSVEKLVTFLKSGLAKRMVRAAEKGKLFRERPFVLGLCANRLNPVFPETETVLIQGIIDVYPEEDDKIVVADYKTDRVSEKEELIRRYQIQLHYYKEALERLTGRQVEEMIIYSFALGSEILLV